MAGVLKSPWASSQTTTAPGSRAARTGSVAIAIEHCAATSTGAGSAIAAAAASSTGRAARRSSAQFWTTGGDGSPTIRTSSPSNGPSSSAPAVP